VSGASDSAIQERTRRWLTWSVVAIAVVTLLGFGLLWPRGETPDLGVRPGTYVDATVVSTERTTCDAVEAEALAGCSSVEVEITSGEDAGGQGVFLIRDTDFGIPEMSVGDRVVLLDVPTSPPPFRYTYSDVQRATPMWWLLALFVVAVLAVGRWQGARALAGLAISGLILVLFVVPALLRDESAVLVALTGTIAIAYLALYLAHGFTHATTVALAGTLASLAIITALALVVAEVAQLSGLANEEAQALRVTASALDLRGLLVAGIVVGALGVLDDVTVTQVSAVAALRRASPSIERRRLYREAMRVGKDHVASTVNTLVLAYAGATLPLVLLFSQGAKSTGRIVTSEIVAVEVVRMLVGSIGLILAVPITTALAAAVLTARDDVHAGHDHADLDDETLARVRGDDAAGGDTAGRNVAGQDHRHEPHRVDWDDFGPREDPI
jgi:uncharacterized membrane protein